MESCQMVNGQCSFLSFFWLTGSLFFGGGDGVTASGDVRASSFTWACLGPNAQTASGHLQCLVTQGTLMFAYIFYYLPVCFVWGFWVTYKMSNCGRQGNKCLSFYFNWSGSEHNPFRCFTHPEIKSYIVEFPSNRDRQSNCFRMYQ